MWDECCYAFPCSIQGEQGGHEGRPDHGRGIRGRQAGRATMSMENNRTKCRKVGLDLERIAQRQPSIVRAAFMPALGAR